MHYSSKTIAHAFRDALAATLLVSVLGYTSYLMLEPIASFGQTAYDQFVVEQSIGSEISFLSAASDITLSAIGGVTGGDSEGYTGVRVYTNDSSGFTMTITASNSPAMQGISQGGNIADYTPATANIPDYTFASTSPGQSAEFGYTISASTTSHLAQKFLDNGSNACNTGSADTNGKTSCWYNLSTTATSTIVTTAESASSGASSTLYFRVHVPANPSPALPEDIYRATSTLTATTN
jgi:hypothetical protein